MADRCAVVAIVGAESTGKTTLARGITQALIADGVNAVMVSEYLREFCDERDRTPYPDEQADIALEQSRRIAQAAKLHDVVVTDTTALMTAVYSEYLFEDRGLYEQALPDHAQARLTILTALDLPWESDGLQRDGEHVREPVDALIRQHLVAARLPFSVVAGQGDHRLNQAMLAVRQALQTAEQREVAQVASGPKWRWMCERCDDGECEQHWLARI